ncbi:MAG: FAD-dependent oxidoreductase [Verrucomicrobiota bacterium]
MRHTQKNSWLKAGLAGLLYLGWLGVATAQPAAKPYDVVVVGGTPGGIMAAIAAAREGLSVVLLERTEHVGGLPANGLGATDIGTRGGTGGLFREFVNRMHSHYTNTYGPNSPQAKDCSDGYHFEPSVAEKLFTQMLAAQPRITVLKMRQFDADPQNVIMEGQRLTGVLIRNRETSQTEQYSGKVLIDATYEGDLAAAAGVPYRLGREAQSEFNEPMAGRVYKSWGGAVGEGSTGLGDNAVQAFNFRICLTREAANRVPIPKPATYNREEYISLIDDIKLNRTTGKVGAELESRGVGVVVNMVTLPNGKTDANNQHLAFLSTDLPEENWPWPTADWAWRDQFARRLRDYNLGLLWFVQNDPGLPEDFRQRCREWGLASNEYQDNGNFPRQVYVREGRRIEGDHLFTALDALPVQKGGRPPLYTNSITASHYSLDSHAVRKREPGRVHCDGFFSYPTKPYTVPYGVIVPKKVEGLLIPVPVSGTHIGFSTLRMEPCWMALGEAAGTAAALSVRDQVSLRQVNITKLQRALLQHQAVLIYYTDLKPEHPHYAAIQFYGVRGFIPGWQAEADKPVTAEQAREWVAKSGVAKAPAFQAGRTTRGEFLTALLEASR